MTRTVARLETENLGKFPRQGMQPVSDCQGNRHLHEGLLRTFETIV